MRGNISLYCCPTEETDYYIEITEGSRKEAKKAFRILLILFWDEVREISNLSKNFPLCEVASGPTRFTEEAARRRGGGGGRLVQSKRRNNEADAGRVGESEEPLPQSFSFPSREGAEREKGPDLPKLISR